MSDLKPITTAASASEERPGRARARLVLFSRTDGDRREPHDLRLHPEGAIVARHWNGDESVFTPSLWVDDVARAYGIQVSEIATQLSAHQIEVHTNCTQEWAEELLEEFVLVGAEDETARELALWVSAGVADPWGLWREDDFETYLLYHEDGRLAAVNGAPTSGPTIAIEGRTQNEATR